MALGISTEQIIGEPMSIVNYGENPVTVLVSAEGRISDLSNAVFVPSPPQEGTLEKEIFLYAEFKAAESPWLGGFGNAENQVLIMNSVVE